MGDHVSSEHLSSPKSVPDRSTRAVLDAIRHVVRTLREASRKAESAVGVSAAQLFVLQRLAGTQALSVNELATRTFTHQSSVSVVVTKLVRRGLVKRARSADDGRRVEISLTAAGRAVLVRAPAATQDRLIAALALVGRATRERLAGDLGLLLDAMGIETGRAPMFFERPARQSGQGARAKKGRGRVLLT
ncbi:MAG: MarR family transcriptional regulator [Myxococcales bacterium]